MYLPHDFFAREAVDVARELIGASLQVTDVDGVVTAGRIVETEAYGGEDDPASHAGRGRTPRSAVMFGPAGVAYVYLIYGIHHCVNIVTGRQDEPGAVLIRALEPDLGRDVMAGRRGLDPARCRDRDIAAGPGRLCQAMGIDMTWNGRPLICAAGPDALGIVQGAKPAAVEATPRIGVNRAVRRRHRFIDPESRCLSA